MVPLTANDDKPMMVLNYANGPGYERFYDTIGKERRNPTKAFESNNIHAEFPAMVPLEWETHGGEDVGVFASGPYAHLFSSAYEQNTIPHIMAYAACIGEGLKSCN